MRDISNQTFVRPEAIERLIKQMIWQNNPKESNGRRTLWTTCVTGACGDVGGDLTRYPGSSGLLYEALLPYHKASSQAIMRYATDGALPVSTVSEQAAILLARGSVNKMEQELLAIGGQPTHHDYGSVCVTGAIQTNDPLKGGERAYLALASFDKPEDTPSVEIWFDAEAWKSKRELQNLLLEVMLLNLMALHMVLPQIPIKYSQLPGMIVCREMDFEPDGDTFTLNPRQSVRYHTRPINDTDLRDRPMFHTDGMRHKDHRHINNPIFIPSSLNWITAGHRYLARVLRALRYEPIFLLGRTHPDKLREPLPFKDVIERVEQCLGRESVMVVEGMGYFAEMAEALNGGPFAIGFDVFLKLVDRNNERMLSDLERIQQAGGSFIVFGRNEQKLDRNLIPDKYQELFICIDEALRTCDDPAWHGRSFVSPAISSSAQRKVMKRPRM